MFARLLVDVDAARAPRARTASASVGSFGGSASSEPQVGDAQRGELAGDPACARIAARRFVWNAAAVADLRLAAAEPVLDAVALAAVFVGASGSRR